MNYQSTRSNEKLSDVKAVLRGIAPDGGLYIAPEISAGDFNWQECLKKDEFGMAEMILSYLLPGFEDMGSLVEKAYRGKFENDRLSPLVKCADEYVLELFHGPTSAFKDVALSMLPQLITKARGQLNIDDKILILTATSGDTGKAALEGFHDVDGTGIIVFYPHGGVSPIQRAQMATQEGNNVAVCAVKGNFDDCQRGVKNAFPTLDNNGKARLSSANSINIGRLAPQVTYYFSAYAQLLAMGDIALGDKVDFIVPTGNFGDILAGYYAKLMGLPVGRLVCAANENNVLRDFINTGVYDTRRPFIRTESPSMDILVSSNLERLLFLASGSDGARVKKYMDELSENGFYKADDDVMAYIRQSFSAGYADSVSAQMALSRVWRDYKYLCDPHTAVAFAVMEQYQRTRWEGNKCVVLSTASPYKFPTAVLKALGVKSGEDEFAQMDMLNSLTGAPVPARLAALRGKKIIHTDVIEKCEITDYVKEKLV